MAEQETDEDTGIEEYHDDTTVPVTLRVMRPFDEIRDGGGNPFSPLRQEVAEGETHDGTAYKITQPMNGNGLRVEFGGGGQPDVEIRLQQLLRSAILAAQTRGYPIDQGDGDPALEVEERVGDVVAALVIGGVIDEADVDALPNFLTETAAGRVDAVLDGDG